MIRADECGRLRDFLGVAALIGLAWQAHPSASLLGGALVLFVGAHRRTMGGKGLAMGVGIAAACALGPSLVLLPWYGSREPWLMMGNPHGVFETLKYVTGKRFVSIQGVFGLDWIRVGSFGLYLGQELLLVGSGLVIWGIAELARRRSRLLWGLAAWTLPYATVTILFKLEGQHDCWFLAAWMPLYLGIGVGAWRLATWKREHERTVLLVAGLLAVGSSIVVNKSEISQRDYLLAEDYGRSFLDPVDRDAVLVLWSDDSNAIVSWLQRVRGDRPDVVLVTSSFLAAEFGSLGYERMLIRRHPDLRMPDYGEAGRQFPNAESKDAAAAAFVRAHAGLARPLFLERMLPLSMMPPGYTLVPSGATWKLVPLPAPVTLDDRYWKMFPVEPEQIAVGARRARGQKVMVVGGSIEVQPQRYEERLRTLLVLARFHLALALTERGQFAHAAALCQSILNLGPEYWDNAEIVHQFAIALYAAGDKVRAERALRRSAEISTSAGHRATARFYLGDISRARGDEAGARSWFEEALAVPGLDPATRAEIESRLKPK
jgi:hypothetical protein